MPEMQVLRGGNHVSSVYGIEGEGDTAGPRLLELLIQCPMPEN